LGPEGRGRVTIRIVRKGVTGARHLKCERAAGLKAGGAEGHMAVRPEGQKAERLITVKGKACVFLTYKRREYIYSKNIYDI
jgi:hypothetical protein